MSKVDLLFVILGIFCYFSILLKLKEQTVMRERYEALMEKRKKYAGMLAEQKLKEGMRKAAAERKQQRKSEFNNIASAAEMLSKLSDQEVMRQSRVTSSYNEFKRG